MVKHSSLFCPTVNNEEKRKKLKTLTTGDKVTKTFHHWRSGEIS
jgi:hypothetical protein